MRINLSFDAPCATTVELLGEFPDWGQPIPFDREGGGHFKLELELAPGTYFAKLLIDGQRWSPLPEQPIERALDTENSILVVGGLSNPVLFSPSRRHFMRPTAGQLLIYIEVVNNGYIKNPEQIPIQVLSKEGIVLHHGVPRWMLAVRDRTLLRYTLPVDAAASSIYFPQSNFTCSVPPVEEFSPPAWLEQGCLYSIFVDRWYRHSQTEDPRASLRTAPSTRCTYYGGDLDGIRKSLDYLQELGATAIALTPILLSESPHRYDTIDFAQIDPRIGGEPALKKLIEACHIRHMGIILDASFTHVHANHFAFRDVLKRQEQSRYIDWFQVRRFPVSLDDPDTYEHYWQMPFLPLTNLKSETLRAHLFSVVEMWCRLGIDGIRLDAADMAPDELWRTLHARLRALPTPPILIAESLAEPTERYIHGKLADIVYDFSVHSELLNWLGGEHGDIADFALRLETILHRRGPNMSQRRLWFLDLHDTNRFLTEVIFYWRLRLALLFLLLRAEPIWFYYGTESAFTSRQRAAELEGTWSDRLPMTDSIVPTKTEGLVRKLLQYRKQLKEHGYGDAVMLTDLGKLVGYERQSARYQLRVVLNLSEEDVLFPPTLRGGQCLMVVEGDGARPREGLRAHQGCVLLWPRD